MSKDATYRRLIQSPRWRALRNAYLAEHPMCEECAAQTPPIRRAANCVHHVVPVESARSEDEAATLCYLYSNLRALCTQCHSNIHAAERSHSKEAHQARQADALERFKAAHPAPTRSWFDKKLGGMLGKDPSTDSNPLALNSTPRAKSESPVFSGKLLVTAFSEQTERNRQK